MSISRSQCAGQKNIAKSGAGTQNRIEVAGKKNAALFEWAAFVKAEKSELVLRVTQLNLIIEWNPQIGFTSGFFVMRFLFVYTHVYTIFLGVPPIW
ncbi:hypothetical protein SO279_003997 [Escherichia coli]|nr:hypothetical protein [Escherichia coli]